MKDTNQSAGDNATQVHAQSVTVIQNGMTVADVEKIAEIVFARNAQVYIAQAQNEARERVDDFNHTFIGQAMADPDFEISSLGRARVQAALFSAQSGFAENGTEELRDVLSKLLLQLIKEPSDTTTEAILRQAIDAAPRLTSTQLNAVSVIAKLTYTSMTNAMSPTHLFNGLEVNYAAYYDAIPSSQLEYSYIGSVGVGFMLYGTTPFEHIHKTYKSIMFAPIMYGEIPHEIRAKLEAEYNQGVSVASDGTEELQIPVAYQEALRNWDGSDYGAPTGTVIELSKYLKSRIESPLSIDDLKALMKKRNPRLFAFLSQLSETNALHFQLNMVGVMIAGIEQENRDPSTPAVVMQVFDQLRAGVEATTPSPEVE
ncbi:hypothetical protein AXK56_04410 [Tsukamurella pulmonis]|uniref:Uncharacterized protein n=1 Tax=Tsukamurella pulmonis TaxID=47312 RepID=A0A1H1DIB4_9ACTN|nr:LPO_1073/Vpar_1526 family protein [Tsukamurella pulmonis]KXO92321.1 hypothetical protein AXK56_04410 [Tsukamurella pulmonis]SDQ76223.1 hypothetical protein SAMN04489765_1744 [Tsukamurella pulmonis]SUP22034.1 Uncharacterised protein [Tsukamurella pulmonis]